MRGALEDVRVIELAGLGALPFGAKCLGDMGADVIRVERISDVPAKPAKRRQNLFDRGRRSIAVDLKHPDGVETVLRLAERADVLLESFRPGVVERLGIGPEPALARNPRLVYGRLTGWGQTGPLAHSAGHSLNYEALTGAIGSMGPRGGPPVPLLQIFGDFAGGGLHLAYGVVCALLEARRSGRGQVVDAAMVDGVMNLFSVFYSMHDAGMLGPLGTNTFDGGAPFYNVYETKDGKYVTIAGIEPHFYRLTLEALGLEGDALPEQWDQTRWPELRERFAAAVRTRTRAEWCEILEGTDACFAPVLDFGEARQHPHNVARGSFPRTEEGGTQVLAAPRLSRTPGDPRPSPDWPGCDTDSVLVELGFSPDEIAKLREKGAIA